MAARGHIRGGRACLAGPKFCRFFSARVLRKRLHLLRAQRTKTISQKRQATCPLPNHPALSRFHNMISPLVEERAKWRERRSRYLGGNACCVETDVRYGAAKEHRNTRKNNPRRLNSTLYLPPLQCFQKTKTYRVVCVGLEEAEKRGRKLEAWEAGGVGARRAEVFEIQW